ncbi:hypothetical protein [Burkholderia sp. BCC1988]|uniref:hypothetical protein n=1 Tax=Burkholderia sp. BCC1988 TaxID=2817443 RepID=UPI002AB10D05|nr:hypothetical protein [Burkholderia sp. BCC1988]
MSHSEYSTRYPVYGYQSDIRSTYADLPCQPFWTWLTGKALRNSIEDGSSDRRMTSWEFFSLVILNYVVIALGIGLGCWVFTASVSLTVKVIASLALIVTIVNRQLNLAHMFHHLAHGVGMNNRAQMQRYFEWLVGVPILHAPLARYKGTHVRNHHGRKSFCTDADPDQQIIVRHGLYKGMPERIFWQRVAFAPFHPARLWEHVAACLRQSFVDASWSHRIVCGLVWIALVVGVVHWNAWKAFAFYYVLPLVVLVPHSSWLQHVTEHLWFADRSEGASVSVFYGHLSWGRFLGRPYPGASNGPLRAIEVLWWWLKVGLVDIPLRLYVFAADLSSHDFHHRHPDVPLIHVSAARAAHEDMPSSYGPMTETWGIVECLLIQRDHICRGIGDPFGILEWERQTVGRMAAVQREAALYD